MKAQQLSSIGEHLRKELHLIILYASSFVADSVEYVGREYYDGCMLDRNHRLVEAAGVLLAVYNGERRGGTAATVRYARKLGRGTIILNPILLSTFMSATSI